MEITRNISAFGPGTASECTVQRWFKEFRKGDESLEDKEHSGRPSKGGSKQLRGPLTEADLLTTMQEAAKELSGNHSLLIQHLQQIGKVRAEYMGAS